MYDRHGYIDLVAKAADQSMQDAVEEVRSLPEYLMDGEVCKCVIN